ncbi:MAG: hypothetical protein OEO19_19230 [Gammaproteobacteria bacterium]|nr:hypothetical protein [Gammaproteobacteria bacterium]MDH3447158.1 hypothetical protein [Gammaproteobacteria bacterium]
MKKLLLSAITAICLTASIFAQAAEKETVPMKIREMVLGLDPAKIGITREKLKHPVWGMIMDTGFADGSFSLIALADGTTSLYFSDGGGIVGGGEHDSVRDASGYYLTGAQYFYKDATRTTTFPLPGDGEVKFYFLSFDGVSVYSALEEDLGNQQDKLFNLFYAAHGVITELRKIEEQ